MRIAIVFDACGTERKRPFVRAEYLTVTTCVPGAFGLDVAKRSVITHAKGINIGAVNYPYVGEASKYAAQEVRAVKAANRVWRYIETGQGEKIAVFFDADRSRWVDADGKGYNRKDIQHLWFNLRTLTEQNQMIASGEAPTVPQEYLDWMDSVQTNSRIVDISKLTGRDMAFCVDRVYFNKNMVPHPYLTIPEFFLCSRHTPEFRKGATEEFILKCARHDPDQPPMLVSELPPGFNCVVRQAWNQDGMLFLEIERVKTHVSSGELSTVECTGDIRELAFPNHNDQVEILRAPIGHEAPTPEDVVHRFQPLVRIIPYDPAYNTYSEVVDVVGEQTMLWLRKQVITQHQPTIEGHVATAVSFLDKLPKEEARPSFFVRNARTAHLVECAPETLVQDVNQFVRVNLLHHQWWEAFGTHHKKNQGNRKSNQKPENSSGIGDMLVDAAESTGYHIA